MTRYPECKNIVAILVPAESKRDVRINCKIQWTH